jgi:hypothetical protein
LERFSQASRARASMDVSRVVWLEAGLERENVEGGVEEVDWGEW